MGYDDDCTSIAFQIVLQDSQGLDVQIVGRLVQNENIRCFHQNSQQVQTTSLTAGQSADGGVLQCGIKQEGLHQLRC